MTKQTLRHDERGLVSIIVTVVLMMVISITVLSFAQIIRREQRSALDNQLSSEAFYAAESGINDVRTYLKTHPLVTKTQCGNDANYTLNMNIDDTTKYTCILINSAPKNLRYDLSTSANSTVFPVTPASSTTNIKTLTLSWTQAKGETAPVSNCHNNITGELPAAKDWQCPYGMIRIDLTPVSGEFLSPSGGKFNRQDLMQNTFTAFIEPTTVGASYGTADYNSGSNINGGAAAQDIHVPATCTGVKCTFTISNMPPTFNGYYARVSTIYKDATLTLAPAAANGNDVPLKDAQYVIDSTGRSQDVLRRIQVRVPLLYTGLHADNGITSNDSLCKKFTTFPGYTNDTPGC